MGHGLRAWSRWTRRTRCARWDNASARSPDDPDYPQVLTTYRRTEHHTFRWFFIRRLQALPSCGMPRGLPDGIDNSCRIWRRLHSTRRLPTAAATASSPARSVWSIADRTMGAHSRARAVTTGKRQDCSRRAPRHVRRSRFNSARSRICAEGPRGASMSFGRAVSRTPNSTMAVAVASVPRTRCSSFVGIRRSTICRPRQTHRPSTFDPDGDRRRSLPD